MTISVRLRIHGNAVERKLVRCRRFRSISKARRRGPVARIVDVDEVSLRDKCDDLLTATACDDVTNC